MRIASRILIGMASVCVLSACRTAARVIEEPRADFEVLEGANRGYLVGTPPPLSQERKATRQMMETEVEIPPLGRPAAQPTDAGSQDAQTAPPSASPSATPSSPPASEESPHSPGTYTK